MLAKVVFFSDTTKQIDSFFYILLIFFDKSPTFNRFLS